MIRLVGTVILTLSCSLSLFGQRTITGRVLDPDGKPVKDAAISLMNTNIETRTNVLGFFQLQIDTVDILVIKGAGYPTMQTKIPPDVKSFSIQLSKTEVEQQKDSVYTAEEEPASFPGGMRAFYEYVSRNMKFPSDAKKKGITGRVYLTFVIDANGEILPNEITIKQGLYPSCDEEAIRLVRESPRWNPGLQRGRPVKQKYSLPIIFK